MRCQWQDGFKRCSVRAIAKIYNDGKVVGNVCDLHAEDAIHLFGSTRKPAESGKP